MTDVSGILFLAGVGGYLPPPPPQGLNIHDNTGMTDISGSNLPTSVGEYLNIHDNAIMTDIEGLNSLTRITGYLSIRTNAALTSISGLNMLTSIGGYLQIFNNPQLTSTAIDLGLASLRCCGIHSPFTYCPARVRSLPSGCAGTGLLFTDEQGHTISLHFACTGLPHKPILEAAQQRIGHSIWGSNWSRRFLVYFNIHIAAITASAVDIHCAQSRMTVAWALSSTEVYNSTAIRGQRCLWDSGAYCNMYSQDSTCTYWNIPC